MARRTVQDSIDWDAIERAYRLGNRTNRQLGVEFGADHSSIGKKAKAKGWVVDKSEEVEAVTNSLLIQSASGNSNPNATPTDKEIKVAAQVAFDVILDHRTGLRRLGVLRDAMLGELETVTHSLQPHIDLAELMDDSGPDATGTWRKDRLNEVYRKAISFSARIDDLKRLTEVDEKVRKGQREAFSIGVEVDASRPTSQYEAILRRIYDAAS